MLVDGKIRDASFQRKTGYVQQQDLHLETSTVREALEFSALLRQPESTPKAEKIAYVDKVIDLLGMQEYADAVVGVLGEGLNVEQRKRLSIGVELAAKPPLLLFVDEPTSGLDPLMQRRFFNLLREEQKNGVTILFSSHILSEVRKLSERIAIIRTGEIVDIKSLAELEEHVGVVEHAGEQRRTAAEGGQRDVRGGVRGLVSGHLTNDEVADIGRCAIGGAAAGDTVVAVAHAGVTRVGIQRRSTVEGLLAVLRGLRVRQPGLVAVGIGAVADQHLAVDVRGQREAISLDAVLGELGAVVGSDDGIAAGLGTLVTTGGQALQRCGRHSGGADDGGTLR